MNIIEWRECLLESDLNYKAKFIGLVLSQFYRQGSATYPAIRTLAQMSGLTVNPVQDGLRILEENKFIVREKRRLEGDKYLSNIYTFTGVTKTRTVSRGDTSNDTSNDTSDDTSLRDTEVVEKDKVDKVGKKIKKPDSVLEQTWNDFKKLRQSKKAPITETAMKKFIKQAEIANWTLEEVFKECCARGWTGFEADWVKNKKTITETKPARTPGNEMMKELMG